MIITGTDLELLVEVFESALEAIHNERGHMTQETPISAVEDLIRYESAVYGLFDKVREALIQENQS